MRVLLTFLMFAFALTACGYKGPLYLPKPKEASQPAAVSQASVASAVKE